VVALFGAISVLVLAFWIPPHLFLGASLLVLASSSAVPPVNVGSITVYTYDVLFALVLLRAVWPRARRVNNLRILDPTVAVPVMLWALVMVVAGFRGGIAGNSNGAIARLEMPLVYFPLFLWGFTRILREKSVPLSRVATSLIITSLGFIVYGAFTRVTHQRFGNANGAGIGVVTTTRAVLRRDYGLWSAFEIYPLLALGGFAYLSFSRRSKLSLILVTGVGLAATLFTLVRGLIFGCIAGAILLIVLSVRMRWHVNLVSRLLPLFAVCGLAGTLFFAVSPVAAHAVSERMLPGILGQAHDANKNTHYRVHALSVAIHVASNEPFGLGFGTPESTERAGYLSIYFPDTQWGTLLALTGWPGIFVFGWAGLALVRRSSRLPAAAPWLHPLVAATALLVLVQGFAWNILFSEPWSLGMIALVLALRFGLAREGSHEPRERSS
jgi:hypothetical protein